LSITQISIQQEKILWEVLMTELRERDISTLKTKFHFRSHSTSFYVNMYILLYS
jgi:hypothetical protein